MEVEWCDIEERTIGRWRKISWILRSEWLKCWGMDETIFRREQLEDRMTGYWRENDWKMKKNQLDIEEWMIEMLRDERICWREQLEDGGGMTGYWDENDWRMEQSWWDSEDRLMAGYLVENDWKTRDYQNLRREGLEDGGGWTIENVCSGTNIYFLCLKKWMSQLVGPYENRTKQSSMPLFSTILYKGK